MGFWQALGRHVRPKPFSPYVPPETKRQEQVAGARKAIGERTRRVTEALYQLTKAQTEAAPIALDLPKYEKVAAVERSLRPTGTEALRGELKRARGGKTGPDAITLAKQMETLEGLGISLATLPAKLGREEKEVFETLASMRGTLAKRKAGWEEYVAEYGKRKTAHEKLTEDLDSLYSTYTEAETDVGEALDVLKQFTEPWQAPTTYRRIRPWETVPKTTKTLLRPAEEGPYLQRFAKVPGEVFTGIHEQVPGAEIAEYERLLAQTIKKPKIKPFPTMERAPYDVK